MFLRRILQSRQLTKRCTPFLNNQRSFCDTKTKTLEQEETNLRLGNIGSKYQIFRDEEAEIVLDVEEEKLKIIQEQDIEIHDPFEGINIEHGKQGVFDIEDLVELLKRDNAIDIFVVEIPKRIQFVDYLCIVSTKSYRHMRAISQFVKKVYKKKKHPGDSVPSVEGGKCNDWMAIDLGNIALHIFSKEARAMYDLESLWTVGPEFDRECNKVDPIVEMLERHSIYLKDLHPAI